MHCGYIILYLRTFSRDGKYDIVLILFTQFSPLSKKISGLLGKLWDVCLKLENVGSIFGINLPRFQEGFKRELMLGDRKSSISIITPYKIMIFLWYKELKRGGTSVCDEESTEWLTRILEKCGNWWSSCYLRHMKIGTKAGISPHFAHHVFHWLMSIAWQRTPYPVPFVYICDMSQSNWGIDE